MIRKFIRLSARLVIALILAICLVLGVVPVIPKREEKTANEILMEKEEENDEWPAKKKKNSNYS
jgi:hypothetical protein